MIYEYALEPELVATWTDRTTFRYYMSSFEFGHGRAVSRYPKHWARLVWQSFSNDCDIAQLRLTELLKHLSQQMVRRRDFVWIADSKCWLENAQDEHTRCAFRAIIARTNPKNHADVLTENDLDPGKSQLWAVSNSLVVERRAAQMADAVASLLRCSSKVIFVDPHFRPQEPRFQKPLAAFLQRFIDRPPTGLPESIELHASTKYECSEDFFRDQCTVKFCRSIPKGMRVLVRRLSEKPDGEKLHNRYILTNLGGVTFGTGLDEGEEGQSDDISMMDRGQFELRWSQYGGDPPAGFEQEGDAIEVVGTRRLRSP